ncbi:hypothetical protein CH341_26790 [Rhodoplanes roseus]|uniref:Uncharacterized protein n=1 Tax=Rhodoplanes roseus TaxID=29409 RepID=A0A327KKI3_9BRAD|nr:hypothetical protein CH341_26790 [Rhodoplanes roseus]
MHGDDTPVPVLARGKTYTGRAWVYVRDDRPFGGHDPPAAVSRDFMSGGAGYVAAAAARRLRGADRGRLLMTTHDT